MNDTKRASTIYAFAKIVAVVAGLGLVAMSFASFAAPAKAAVVPETPAIYDGFLASGIGKSDTSMTLSTPTTRDGNPLEGYYCFTLDVNLPTVEYACGTASGGSVTGLSRGVSVADPRTTSTNYTFSHRRFASVTVSDYPTIQILGQKLNGTDTIDNAIRYTNKQPADFTSGQDIINRAYADSLSFGDVPPASEDAAGFVELATGAEAAASTASGDAARLALPTTISTSTYNAGTAANVIPVTNSLGHVDAGFIASSTNFTVSGTAYLNGPVSIANGLSTVSVFTSGGTWNKPTGAKTATVILIGAGGGGEGGGGGNSSCSDGGSGGSGGGYTIATFQASALASSYTVSIGTGGPGGAGSPSSNSCVIGAGTTGGNTTFGTILTAGGGVGGAGAGGIGIYTGGVGAIGASSGATPTGVASLAGQGGGSGGGDGGHNGGAGGANPIVPSVTGGTGGTSSTGGNGSPASITDAIGGGGGGGGFGVSSGSGATSVGGTGGLYGAGGGGGGSGKTLSASTGNPGGAGGPGSNGIAIVISQF